MADPFSFGYLSDAASRAFPKQHTPPEMKPLPEFPGMSETWLSSTWLFKISEFQIDPMGVAKIQDPTAPTTRHEAIAGVQDPLSVSSLEAACGYWDVGFMVESVRGRCAGAGTTYLPAQ